MAAQTSGEIVFNIRLNGKSSLDEVKKIEKAAVGSFRNVARVGGAALAFFYGGIARQAASEMANIGDMIGRATPFGQTNTKFYSKLGAARTATDKTVESFGMAGAMASRDQILSMYNVHKQIEEQYAAGDVRVRNVISEKRTDEIVNQAVKDFDFAVKNFGSFIRELGKQFKPW